MRLAAGTEDFRIERLVVEALRGERGHADGERIDARFRRYDFHRDLV